MAMESRTMSRWAAGKTVQLDHALKSFSFRHTFNIYKFYICK
jgi:hypothetical protein